MQSINKLKDFNELLNEFNHKPILLDFHTNSCEPCVSLLPTLRKLSKEYKEVVEIKKVDIEVNKELAERFRVKKTPLLILIKNREIVNKIKSIPSEKELRNCLELIVD